jgi:hypothetical protein
VNATRYALLALVLLAAERADAQEGAPPVPAPEQTPSTPAEASAPADSVGAPTQETPNTVGAEPNAAESSTAAAAAPSELATPSQEAELPEQLTDAELAALGLSMEEQGLDTELHFSGFMDVNMLQLLNPKEAPTATRLQGDEASFFVGRFNLYATKNITESFRMMAEVRFLYAPNGSQGLLASSGVTNTEVSDYTGNGAFMRWGGILIERAYGEWSPLSFFNLRLGAFLTPYGIWNVDHGSPVFIPVMRPYAVNGTFFPERQTGLEAFGRVGLSTKLALRYHLTLSNGLGPVSEYRDLDSNKAVGGRLVLDYVGRGTFQVGGSAFYGQNSAGSVGLGISADGSAVTADKVVTDQANITALAGDVLWKYRGLHLQAEWVGEHREYTKAGRTRVSTAGQAGVPVNGVSPDMFNWAGYVMAGYRLPWWGIMPFATLEYQRSNTWGIQTRTAFSQVGLNIRPADAIVLKLEYQFAFAGTEETLLKVIAAQLAWAF